MFWFYTNDSPTIGVKWHINTFAEPVDEESQRDLIFHWSVPGYKAISSGSIFYKLVAYDILILMNARDVF